MTRPSYICTPKPDDIIVDNSKMKEVLKCSTAAVLRYGLHLAPKVEGPQLLQGQAGHVAMATWLETGDGHLALKAYREAWPPVEAALAALPVTEKNQKEVARLAFKRTRQLLRAWFDARPLASWPLVVAPEQVEHAVSAPLMKLKDGRRVVFVALLDALAKRRTGGLWSVDHKFRNGVTDWWKEKQQDSSQFTGQVWLGKQWDLPLAGVYVNVIEVPGVKTGKAKCPTHGQPYWACDLEHARHELFPVARSATEIAAWQGTLAKHVPRWVKLKERVTSLEDIHSVPMEGRFNESCTFCGFREWCRVGRPVGGRGDWFVEHEWNPLAERRGNVA